MNRRTFLASLGAALAACWVPKAWRAADVRPPKPNDYMPWYWDGEAWCVDTPYFDLTKPPVSKLNGPTWEGAVYDETGMVWKDGYSTNDLAALEGEYPYRHYDPVTATEIRAWNEECFLRWAAEHKAITDRAFDGLIENVRRRIPTEPA